MKLQSDDSMIGIRIAKLEAELAETRKDAEIWESAINEIDAILDPPKQSASVCSVVVDAVKRLTAELAAITKENEILTASRKEAMHKIERLRGEVGTPSEDYWDQHAHHCGNCNRALLTRGGLSASPLSDPGQSEDEALCGSCAGVELDRVEADKTDYLEARKRLEELR